MELPNGVIWGWRLVGKSQLMYLNQLAMGLSQIFSSYSLGGKIVMCTISANLHYILTIFHSSIVRVKNEKVVFILRSIQFGGPLKALYTLCPPPGRPVHSDTNSAFPGSILDMQQLRATTKSLTFQLLSIARYSFIQLSQWGVNGENKNALYALCSESSGTQVTQQPASSARQS